MEIIPPLVALALAGFVLLMTRDDLRRDFIAWTRSMLH